MSLNAKLAALSKSPETVQLKDLVGRSEAPVVGARRVTTRFGKMAVVIDIQGDDGILTSVFLPNKYADALEDTDLETIARDGYKLHVTDSQGSLPNVSIFK